MPTSQAEIDEVVGAMNELVSRDGGTISVLGYEEAAAILRLEYETGSNDECSTCLISPETLSDFVKEGLKARGVPVTNVVVQAP